LGSQAFKRESARQTINSQATAGSCGLWEAVRSSLRGRGVQQLVQQFSLSTLFKHDPRYFRLGNGTFKRRLLYGLAQEFVCHTDKGGRSFSYSNVLGALSGGALSNAYYPSSDRGFRLTMSRSGLALAYGAAGGLISEFWPDIQRKLFQKRKKENAAPPVTPPQNGNQK